MLMDQPLWTYLPKFGGEMNTTALTFLSILLALATTLLFLNRDKLSGYIPPKHIDYFKLSGVPRPKPLPDFDISTTKPRPYRPFRWPYHQTMAVMAMDPDYWLELESTYRFRLAQRCAIYQQQKSAVLQTLPGSASAFACRELMEMVIQFLCARYPKLFSYNRLTGSFWNGILHKTFDVRPSNLALDPLVFLIENVPEDFAIMVRDEESGVYYLRAGVVVSSIGWNLGQKMGMKMREIHTPVPDYREKIEGSVNRYLTKLTPDKPIQRGSWGFEVGEQLYLQTTDPHWSSRAHQDPSLTPSQIFLRVDWQTLRRLPRSQAIVFNFKALFTPLEELRREPRIPRLLGKVLREGKGELLEYKGVRHTLHVVLPTLDAWAREQEEKGCGFKEGVRTLDEHPFYPGWDEDRNVVGK